MDFYQITTREIEKGPKKGFLEIYPDFKVGRSKDLMIRGGKFYAIWDEEEGLWSTDEYAVQRIVDNDLKAYADARKAEGLSYVVKYLRSASSGMWFQFRRYMQNISDNSHQLDESLTFANTDVKKSDYVSRRLPYSLEPGPHDSWDELVGTLYSVEERAKIEWGIGAIISGDSKKIQKFFVLYGPPGHGKGTIINVILKLFPGYTASIDAKALGSSNAQFATDVFKDNPLVGFQQDGDLSKIEDNARLNSIISHEDMSMNEKWKSSYTARVNAILWLGTNKPVKISDAKSGIIRRLVDIHPTGVIIPTNHYHTLISQIDFELGAIAQHCLEVYLSMGKNFYNGYKPLEMMLQTDIFFNFIEANFDIFKGQDYTTLKQAYSLYKEFCEETGIAHVQPQYKFREELRNYFDEFKERTVIDGQNIRSYYSGFNASKFKTESKKDNTFSLVIEETESLFDKEYATQPAQYEVHDDVMNIDRPKNKWEKVKTTLADIDTSQIHYTKVPEEHIVIDFDLEGVDGKKSLERNLEAASVWPPTYAELSKSGAGVHLHYDYEGDVSELSNVYSEGIEVKTLLGDAALRRRLSKCNNVPVATLKAGTLPLKEKSVISDKTMKSEKGLRDLIEKNLRKEVHAFTKPSVDFIKKITDEAYESGMAYDITDMRSRIMAFANNSSSQALQCIKVVQTIQWKSEHEASVDPDKMTPSEKVEMDQAKFADSGFVKDDRLVFYDVEVYPNLFVVCWKFAGEGSVVKMINPKASDIENLLKLKLVGYNCRRYDNHILYGALMGLDNEGLYKLSQNIINGNRDAMYGAAYNLSYADIYDFAAIKQTLKKWMIELGIRKQEMELPWDQPVDEDLWDFVVEYCCNDVEGTEAVFNHLRADFTARQILADLSGLTVNDTTAKHTSRIIFGNEKNPQQYFNNPDLSEEFPGYKFDLGKSEYRGENPSEGGYVYAEPGIYENVVELDIASMHPTSIEQLNLFGKFTPKFSALKSARLAIKHKDYDSAKEMLEGKLAPHLTKPEDAKALSYALKIVINTVYGLTSARFENTFKSHKNIDNKVAKRGALFMIDLKHACQEKGLKVVHIKTDSIKIPNATQEDIDEIMAFGSKYGYDFEHDATYSKFCLVNDAVYIAKYGWSADEDLIGKWTPTGAQFQHPYVFKTLFTHDEVTFDDLCETKSVQKGALYLDFEHDKPEPMVENMQFVGKIGRFVPVQENCGGGVLYRVVDGKPNAAAGSKGYLWMEAEKAAALGKDVKIDSSYFDKLAESARQAIDKYGNFEEFVS